jgi:hypothetical protein
MAVYQKLRGHPGLISGFVAGGPGPDTLGLPMAVYQKLRGHPGLVSGFVAGGPGPDTLGPPMAVREKTESGPGPAASIPETIPRTSDPRNDTQLSHICPATGV